MGRARLRPTSPTSIERPSPRATRSGLAPSCRSAEYRRMARRSPPRAKPSSFRPAGRVTNIAVPNATIVFSSATTTASFCLQRDLKQLDRPPCRSAMAMATGGTAGEWGGSGRCNDDNNDGGGSTVGNVFLTAVSFPVQVALPGNVGPVTWSAAFASNTAGLRVNWEWAAAVYNKFGTRLQRARRPKPAR